TCRSVESPQGILWRRLLARAATPELGRSCRSYLDTVFGQGPLRSPTAMSSAQNPPSPYIARLAALPSNGVALMLASVALFVAGTLLVKHVSLRSELSFWTLTLP